MDEAVGRSGRRPAAGDDLNQASKLSCHDEVLHALEKVAEPERAATIKADRRTGLNALAVRASVLRRVVKSGFSFSSESEEQVLKAWDLIWSTTSCFEVMNAPLDYYGARTCAEGRWLCVARSGACIPG